MCLARPSFAPSIWAIVSLTSAGSRSADRPTQKTPALNAATSSEATSSASRVLPEPPGPARVTRREPFRTQRDELVPLAGPADEGGGRARQVRVRDRIQRREALRSHLEERDRLVEVLQAVLAELHHLASDERPGRRRQHDLAAVARSGNASGTVELAPGVALAGQLQLARVQPHPHRYGARRERRLTICCGRERLDRIGERVQECVPLRVDLDAPVLGNSATQEQAVLGQRLNIAFLPELLDQPRRALDVSEEQCHGAGRKIHTHRSRSSAAKDRPSSPPVCSGVGPLGWTSVLSPEG